METNNPFLIDLLEGAIEKTYERNEFILTEGKIEHNIYVIKSGAVRAFFLTELEELTIRFGYSGSIINSLSSFIKETPSQLYIQALRQTNIAVIPRTHFYQTVNKSHDNLLAYNKLLETVLSEQIEREIDLLTQSPSERLQRILARSPHLFQEIPHKYIANYLRMTPETLSRILKKG